MGTTPVVDKNNAPVEFESDQHLTFVPKAGRLHVISPKDRGIVMIGGVAYPRGLRPPQSTPQMRVADTTASEVDGKYRFFIAGYRRIDSIHTSPSAMAEVSKEYVETPPRFVKEDLEDDPDAPEFEHSNWWEYNEDKEIWEYVGREGYRPPWVYSDPEFDQKRFGWAYVGRRHVDVYHRSIVITLDETPLDDWDQWWVYGVEANENIWRLLAKVDIDTTEYIFDMKPGRFRRRPAVGATGVSILDNHPAPATTDAVAWGRRIVQAGQLGLDLGSFTLQNFSVPQNTFRTAEGNSRRAYLTASSPIFNGSEVYKRMELTDLSTNSDKRRVYTVDYHINSTTLRLAQAIPSGDQTEEMPVTAPRMRRLERKFITDENGDTYGYDGGAQGNPQLLRRGKRRFSNSFWVPATTRRSPHLTLVTSGTGSNKNSFFNSTGSPGTDLFKFNVETDAAKIAFYSEGDRVDLLRDNRKIADDRRQLEIREVDSISSPNTITVYAPGGVGHGRKNDAWNHIGFVPNEYLFFIPRKASNFEEIVLNNHVDVLASDGSIHLVPEGNQYRDDNRVAAVDAEIIEINDDLDDAPYYLKLRFSRFEHIWTRTESQNPHKWSDASDDDIWERNTLLHSDTSTALRDNNSDDEGEDSAAYYLDLGGSPRQYRFYLANNPIGRFAVDDIVSLFDRSRGIIGLETAGMTVKAVAGFPSDPPVSPEPLQVGVNAGKFSMDVEPVSDMIIPPDSPRLSSGRFYDTTEAETTPRTGNLVGQNRVWYTRLDADGINDQAVPGANSELPPQLENHPPVRLSVYRDLLVAMTKRHTAPASGGENLGRPQIRWEDSIGVGILAPRSLVEVSEETGSLLAGDILFVSSTGLSRFSSGTIFNVMQELKAEGLWRLFDRDSASEAVGAWHRLKGQYIVKNLKAPGSSIPSRGLIWDVRKNALLVTHHTPATALVSFTATDGGDQIIEGDDLGFIGSGQLTEVGSRDVVVEDDRRLWGKEAVVGEFTLSSDVFTGNLGFRSESIPEWPTLVFKDCYIQNDVNGAITTKPGLAVKRRVFGHEALGDRDEWFGWSEVTDSDYKQDVTHGLIVDNITHKGTVSSFDGVSLVIASSDPTLPFPPGANLDGGSVCILHVSGSDPDEYAFFQVRELTAPDTIVSAGPIVNSVVTYDTFEISGPPSYMHEIFSPSLGPKEAQPIMPDHTDGASFGPLVLTSDDTIVNLPGSIKLRDSEGHPFSTNVLKGVYAFIRRVSTGRVVGWRIDSNTTRQFTIGDSFSEEREFWNHDPPVAGDTLWIGGINFVWTSGIVGGEEPGDKSVKKCHVYVKGPSDLTFQFTLAFWQAGNQYDVDVVTEDDQDRTNLILNETKLTDVTRGVWMPPGLSSSFVFQMEGVTLNDPGIVIDLLRIIYDSIGADLIG